MCNLLHPPTAQAANAAFKEVASQYRKALTDVAVAQAMLYGATRLRHRGTAHKMVCSPRR